MSTAADPDALAGVFKAASEPVRLRILALLAHGELCVCHIHGLLDLPQPTVSRHLAILRHAGLVLARRDGSWVNYALAPAAEQWLGTAVAGWRADPEIARLCRSVRACS